MIRLLFACLVLAIGCSPDTRSATQADVVPLDAIIDVNTILLSPEMLTIVGAPGIEATTNADVSGLGISELTGVMLTDPNIPAAFRFTNPACAMPACTFMPGLALPRQITIACTPSATPRFGTVTVLGPGATMDSSTIECIQTANTPGLTVPDPTPISAQVDTTAMVPLSITNTGNVALDISLQLTPGSDWNATMCVAPASCQVDVGMAISVPLAFTPIAHGNRSSTLQVLSSPDAGTKFVTLDGTGLGGVLRVDQPATFAHDFGTIAKGQLATVIVAMSNTGNVPITIAPQALAAPYVVETTPIDIPAGGTGMFEVGCMSATPGGPFPVTLELDPSANVYDRNTSTIELDCAIANTTVQVVPNPVPFGELRVGEPTKSIEVTITNPAGGGNVTIERITLRGAPAALTQGAPSSPLPATLQDTKSLTTTLELATTADVSLSNVTLEVEVTESETVLLEIPVTGEVGTPRVEVIPDTLRLGTVCVGTPVMGNVTMTNTGTITLVVQRPVMTSTSFAPLFTNPTEYPDPPDGHPLLEGDAATVGVMPATQQAGKIEGTLEWDVNVPLAPFRIPVSLELIASGTAVSPAGMKFGANDLGARSTVQVVTLENCGTEPALVTYSGVHALEGRAGAWVLDPPGDQRTLNPDATMRIMVAFAPKEPGKHRANIAIDVDGNERLVELDGDGIGTLPEKTSFYACACGAGAGSTSAGWPILVAIALVIGRRRYIRTT